MKKLHLLCNAHLDPCWLWEWEEGAAEALSTFRTAADICEQNDTFIFNHNEATLYRWVEEYEPELFARIQELARAGRWHIMGGWHLQPDCNMPRGESFVRQILSGRRYFREKFGAEPTTAINFDPFGHSRGLVQILRKSGYTAYLFGRPHEEIFPLPPDGFVWVGYDGSAVDAHRFIGWYNAPLGKAREKAEKWMQDNADREIGLMLWGVGNHGGGPSRKDIADLNALIAAADMPEIVHATPEAYFEDIRRSGVERPRMARDLNSWAPGCYTSQVRLKQRHRQLENALYMAEKMAATAALQGLMDYPREALHEAMMDLLTAEFHDILPGSSVQPVEEAGLRLMDHGLEILSRLRARSFFALASGQPCAQEGTIPILAYNPHPYPLEGVFECEFNLPDFNFEDTFTVPMVRLNGEPIPCQVEKELGNLPVDWRKRCVFRATLAPAQMTRFDCTLETMLPARPAHGRAPENGVHRVVTDDIEVVVDARTGLMRRFVAHGVDCLRDAAFTPLVMADNPDPWTAEALSYREIAGCFAALPPDAAGRICGLGGPIDPVHIIEDGPVRTVIEAVMGYGDSFLVLTYKIPKQGAELEIHVRVHWNEKDKMLKLALPIAFDEPKYMGQTAYGRDVLPGEEREVVAQQWVAAVSERDGMALTCINDGSYGSDFPDREIRLTLLRSPAYSGLPFKDRPLVRQDAYTPRIEQGEREFRFWITAGPLPQRMTRIEREALAHNEKPFLLSFNPRGAGDAPLPGILLDDDAVVIGAFKRAEDSGAYIVRLFEPSGCASTTTLRIPAAKIVQEIRLQPFEIKTLLVDPVTGTVQETDLLERPFERQARR